MTKEQALYDFWNSFGMKAYPNTNIPKNAELPYIEYEVRTDSHGEITNCATKVWYKTTSEAIPNTFIEKIAKRLSNTGEPVECDEGFVIVMKGNPWCINQSAEDDNTIKLRFLNVQYKWNTFY